MRRLNESSNRKVLVLRGFSLFFLLTLLSGNACALFSSAFNEAYHTLSTNVARTWNMPEHYDLYIPSITWHARFAYDQEKIEQYNERPWGAGFGVSSQDEKGNWHGLYLMAFKDSFNKWEPVGGYGWEKKWRPLTDQNVQLGLGYTIGVTARDNWNYIPVPVVLPLASVGYGPVTFQMTYIPGTYNNGNVYFAWARIRF
ncbi:phospholipid:lipid A palmitoyltransferase [Escherichia coli]|nr:phospholipid:lipid A palmitoyltransferase [Escherichia coli]EFO3747909.1 phospholipid:lipid A palmitoyltransferase [Escherichia coli]